ncbi:hypothetical protein RclHR1_04590001 [Rhizophagus clarus]|uniref:Uncharacterized protein n=1 Tax=Rhizophagus clarus TaxID=94130 RepID=A0A2Z6RHW3_9GLOM|nr:hypothetical protein RclHR1_04590001 [Rhizophagus clarus]
MTSNIQKRKIEKKQKNNQKKRKEETDNEEFKEKFYRLNANILMKLDKIHERQKALETQLSRMDSEMDTRMKKYLKTIKDWILKIEENNTKDSFNTDFIEKIVKSVSKKLMEVSIYPTTE